MPPGFSSMNWWLNEKNDYFCRRKERQLMVQISEIKHRQRRAGVHTRPARPSAIRFCRWSRKSYAAFVSQKREIIIGQLAIAIADRMQQKQLSLHTGIRLSQGDSREQLHAGEQDRERSEEFFSLLPVNGYLCNLLFTSDETACPAWACLHVKNLPRRDESERIHPAFFYTLKYTQRV